MLELADDGGGGGGEGDDEEVLVGLVELVQDEAALGLHAGVQESRLLVGVVADVEPHGLEVRVLPEDEVTDGVLHLLQVRHLYRHLHPAPLH